MALLRLGKVVRAVGLRGHLGVAGSEGALAALRTVALRKPGEGTETRTIEEARRQGRLWAVKVAGISDREAADAWIGAEVLAEREDLGEAGPDRYYWEDLRGIEVSTVSGERLGTVTGLCETGGVDVLVVTGAGGEALVPLAPWVEVDVGERKIVVDPPEGLFGGEGRGGRGGEEGEPKTRRRRWRGSRPRS
ncbi:MAG TPA: ribosome maturation factor RimM [Anaeromyxobacteraceae bacterium]|nr:ribosome maturation factor RimM [Anaeromyxobacteraceae bacterium]